ncbi:MAG: hypothetical protein ACR2H3_14265 [Acidimicrobiales bacterium]
METALLDSGEELSVLERVIVSPGLGVFTPHEPSEVTTEGEIVRAGQEIGTVSVSGHTMPVLSPFTGFLMGLLAHPGERVRDGQPVAWLRAVAA